MTIAVAATGRPERALGAWLMAMCVLSCAPAPSPLPHSLAAPAGDASGDGALATFAGGAEQLSLQILSPADNAELFSAGEPIDVPMALVVTGVEITGDGYGLRFWLDGGLVAEVSSADPFVFEAVPHGRHHLAVELVDASGEPVVGARAGVHVRVAVPCVTTGDCEDGLSCSIDACIASQCRYGAEVGCCDHDLECAFGELCSEGVCVACVADSDCGDDDVCTTHSCVEGSCLSTLAEGCCLEDPDCDDGDLCTVEACADGGCSYVPVADPLCCNQDADCVPEEPTCVVSMCYVQALEGVARCRYGPPTAGCCLTDAACDDGHPCTVDACLLGPDGFGECVSGPDPEQPGCCLVDAECDDGVVSTDDACVEGECEATEAPDFCELPDAGPVVLTEISAAGEDGWLELFAPSGEAVSLDGWHAAFAAADGEALGSADLGGTLAAGEYAVHQVPVPQGVGLVVLADGDGGVVDVASWGEAGLPVAVVHPWLDNGATSAWAASEGTPGGPNTDVFVPLSHGACEDGSATCEVGGCGLTARCELGLLPGCCAGDADCEPGGPCGTVACDAGNNTCVPGPALPGCCAADAGCDDGNPCTEDRCIGSVCRHGPTDATGGLGCCSSDLECDDGDPCTIGTCGGGNGCVQTELAMPPGVTCCAGDGDCDDDVSGTLDLCVGGPPGACASVPGPAFCTSTIACDDGDPCTTDACDPALQQCTHQASATCCASDSACSDGDLCTVDTCDLATGQCSHVAVAECCHVNAECSDGNPCTVDSCSAGGVCHNVPTAGCCVSGGDCADGDPCSLDDCVAGSCVSAPAPGCCLTDADCPTVGACTAGVCIQGLCGAVSVAGCCAGDTDCADGNPCTVDVCKPNVMQCAHIGAQISGCCASGADCAAEAWCTSEHKCEALGEVGGACVSDLSCASGLCHEGACRAVGGAGAPCAHDGDCEAGTCQSGNCCMVTAPFGESCDGSDADSCEWGVWECSQDGLTANCVETVEELLEACGNGVDDDCDGAVDEPDCGGCLEVAGEEQPDDGIDSDCDGLELFGDDNELQLLAPMPAGSGLVEVVGDYDMGPLGIVAVQGALERHVAGPVTTVRWCVAGVVSEPGAAHQALLFAEATLCRGSSGGLDGTLSGEVTLKGLDVGIAGAFDPAGGLVDWQVVLPEQLVASEDVLQLSPQLAVQDAELRWDAEGSNFLLDGVVAIGKGPAQVLMRIASCDPAACEEQPCCMPYHPSATSPFYLPLQPESGQVWFPFAGDGLGGELGFRQLTGHLQRYGGVVSASVTARGTCSGDCCGPRKEAGCSDALTEACVGGLRPSCRWEEWSAECADLAAICPATLSPGDGGVVSAQGGFTTQARAWGMTNPTNPRAVLLATTTVTHPESDVDWTFPARGAAQGCASRPMRQCVCAHEPACCAFDTEIDGAAPWTIDCHLLAQTICSVADPQGCGDGSTYLEGSLFSSDAPGVGTAGDGRELLGGKLKFGPIDVDVSTPAAQAGTAHPWALAVDGDASFCVGPRCNGPSHAPEGPSSLSEPVLECALGALISGASPEKTPSMAPAVVVCARPVWACAMNQCQHCRDDFDGPECSQCLPTTNCMDAATACNSDLTAVDLVRTIHAVIEACRSDVGIHVEMHASGRIDQSGLVVRGEAPQLRLEDVVRALGAAPGELPPSDAAAGPGVSAVAASRLRSAATGGGLDVFGTPGSAADDMDIRRGVSLLGWGRLPFRAEGLADADDSDPDAEPFDPSWFFALDSGDGEPSLRGAANFSWRISAADELVGMATAIDIADLRLDVPLRPRDLAELILPIGMIADHAKFGGDWFETTALRIGAPLVIDGRVETSLADGEMLAGSSELIGTRRVSSSLSDWGWRLDLRLFGRLDSPFFLPDAALRHPLLQVPLRKIGPHLEPAGLRWAGDLAWMPAACSDWPDIDSPLWSDQNAGCPRHLGASLALASDAPQTFTEQGKAVESNPGFVWPWRASVALDGLPVDQRLEAMLAVREAGAAHVAAFADATPQGLPGYVPPPLAAGPAPALWAGVSGGTVTPAHPERVLAAWPAHDVWSERTFSGLETRVEWVVAPDVGGALALDLSGYLVGTDQQRLVGTASALTSGKLGAMILAPGALQRAGRPDGGWLEVSAEVAEAAHAEAACLQCPANEATWEAWVHSDTWQPGAFSAVVFDTRGDSFVGGLRVGVGVVEAPGERSRLLPPAASSDAVHACALAKEPACGAPGVDCADLAVSCRRAARKQRPGLRHVPVVGPVTAGSDVPLTIEPTSVRPARSVRLHFRLPGVGWQSTALAAGRCGGTQDPCVSDADCGPAVSCLNADAAWHGRIPGEQLTPGVVEYRVEAIGPDGDKWRLPHEGPAETWRFDVRPAGGRVSVELRSPFGARILRTVDPVVPEDRWVHLSVVIDDGSANVFIDAVPVALVEVLAFGAPETAPIVPAPTGEPLRIGVGVGAIDDVRLWARALSEGDIATSRFVLDPEPEGREGLVARWTFDEGDGTIAHDGPGAEVASAEWIGGAGPSALGIGPPGGVRVVAAAAPELQQAEMRFEVGAVLPLAAGWKDTGAAAPAVQLPLSLRHTLGAASADAKVAPLVVASMAGVGDMALGAPGQLLEGDLDVASGSFAAQGVLALLGTDGSATDIGSGRLSWECPAGWVCAQGDVLPGYRLQAHASVSLASQVGDCAIGVHGTLCATWWPAAGAASSGNGQATDAGCQPQPDLGLAEVLLPANADLLAGVASLTGDVTVCGDGREVVDLRVGDGLMSWTEHVDLSAIAGSPVGLAYDVPLTLRWSPLGVGAIAEVEASILGGPATGLLEVELAPQSSFRFDGFLPELALTSFGLPSVMAAGVSVAACGGAPHPDCPEGHAGVLLAATDVFVPNLFSGGLAGWMRAGDDTYLSGEGLATPGQDVALSTRVQVGSACVDGACSVGGTGCSTTSDCNYDGVWADVALSVGGAWITGEVQGPLVPNGPHVDFSLSGSGTIANADVSLADVTLLWTSQTGSWQLAVGVDVPWMPGLSLVGFLDSGADGLVLQGFAPSVAIGPLQLLDVAASLTAAQGLLIETATVTVGQLFESEVSGLWSPGVSGALKGEDTTLWAGGTQLDLELSIVGSGDGNTSASLAGTVDIGAGWLETTVEATAPLTAAGAGALSWTVNVPGPSLGALTIGGAVLEIMPHALTVRGWLDLGPFAVEVAIHVAPDSSTLELDGTFTEGLFGGLLWLEGGIEGVVAPGGVTLSAMLSGTVHGLGSQAPFELDLLSLEAEAQPVPGQVLFDTSFDTDGLDEWTIVAQTDGGPDPDWSVASGVLTQATAAGRSYIATGADFWTDYQLSARLRSLDDKGVDLLFRMTGSEDYYALHWHGGAGVTELRRVVDGAVTVLGSLPVSYDVGEWFQPVIEVTGSRIRVWQDGELLFDRNDGHHPSGYVAVATSWNAGTHVDELSVVAPDGCSYRPQCQGRCLECQAVAVPCQQCQWQVGCQALMYGLCILPAMAAGTHELACSLAVEEPGYECLVDEVVVEECSEAGCSSWHGCAEREPSTSLVCAGAPASEWLVDVGLAPVIHGQLASSGVAELSWSSGEYSVVFGAEMELPGAGTASLVASIEATSSEPAVAATAAFSGQAHLELPGVDDWTVLVLAKPHGLVFNGAPFSLWGGVLSGTLQGHTSWAGVLEAGGTGQMELGGALSGRAVKVEAASDLGLVAWGELGVDSHALPFTVSVAPGAVSGVMAGHHQWTEQTLPIQGQGTAVETIVVASIDELPDQDGWACQPDLSACLEVATCCDTCAGPGGLPVQCGCATCCKQHALVCQRPVTQSVQVPVSVSFDMTLSGVVDDLGVHPGLAGVWKLSGGLGGDGVVSCSFELGLCQVSMPPELGVVDLDLQ